MTKKLFNGYFEQFQKGVVNKFEYPKGTYYTDVIKANELLMKLEQNEHILLTGGIGTGKTTLCKDLFKLVSERDDTTVFYLGNRHYLVEQLSYKDEIFHKSTYQTFTSDESEEMESFETLYKKGQKIIIVMDEIHYVFSDASFNDETIKILEFIKEYGDTVGFVFISASADSFFNKLTNEYLPYNDFTEYYIPDNLDHIKSYYHYTSIRYNRSIIDSAITMKHKVIIFSNSTKTWKWLEEKYEDKVCFIQTKNVPDPIEDADAYKRWIERDTIAGDSKDKLKKGDKGYWFDCSILCCTSTLDNGINIVDPLHSIEQVFIEFNNPTSIYQAIGRVRKDRDLVQFNVFFKVIHQQQFINSWKKLIGVDLSMSEKEAFKEEVAQMAINECKQENRRETMILYRAIHNRISEDGYYVAYFDEIYYKRVFKGQFIPPITKTNEAKAEDTKANVKEWLDAHMNDWFNKEVFNELVDIINRHAGKHHDNQIKSFSKVKSYLELELKMNLEKTRKTVKGKKDTYYMITEM